MFCSKCGNKVEDTNKFCSKCGNPITNTINNTNVVSNTSVNPSINPSNVNSTPSFNPTPVMTNVTPVNTNVVNTVTPVSVKKSSSNMINKILVIVIVCVGLFTLLFVGKTILDRSKNRVVMIYMVGADLESKNGLATRDLSDLDYKKLKANNTKVVLIAGGAKAWKNNYIDVNETAIYYLGENGFEKVDSRPITNMGSTDNLTYFLNYVYKNYKASKYNFIYWNHGGAVDGSEYDELSNDNLKLVEMSKAFYDSPFKNNNKLETISFRTCLNSTIEMANIYKNYAKYLIASEEITIGSQMDSAIKFLNNVKPTDNPVEFGKKQIEGYKSVVNNTCNYIQSKSLDENYCTNSTYSITDLSKIDDLSKKVNDFAADLNSKLSSNYRDFSRIRANMRQYAEDDLGYDMIDLYDLAESFDKYSIKSKALRESIDKAVVYNWTNNDYSHGLSVYFPYNGNYFLSKYDTMSTSSDYTKLVNNFYKMKSGMKISSYNSFSNNTLSVSKKDEKEADVEVELTEEQINNMAKASYLVFVDTKDGYHKAIYNGFDVKVEGNKLKASVRDRLLRISDSEYEDENNWMLLLEEEVTDDYVDLKTNLYLANTTAIFFDKTYPATAIIRIDDEHPTGYIKSLSIDSKSEKDENNQFAAFAPVAVNITDYNFVAVLNSGYKLMENGEFNKNWINNGNHVVEGKAFRTNNFKFIKEDFSDKFDYYLVFRVYDIANNEYDSKPIKLN